MVGDGGRSEKVGIPEAVRRDAEAAILAIVAQADCGVRIAQHLQLTFNGDSAQGSTRNLRQGTSVTGAESKNNSHELDFE